MLTGSYFITIDVKGRVFVPTKLRYQLGERIWLVKGIDPCLNIFTQEAWTAYTNEYISNRSLKDDKARKLQRHVFGSTYEIEIDRQGRVNLPQNLIEYAGIDKDVVFVGCKDYVELWGAEAFEREMDPANLDPNGSMRDAAEAAGEE